MDPATAPLFVPDVKDSIKQLETCISKSSAYIYSLEGEINTNLRLPRTPSIAEQLKKDEEMIEQIRTEIYIWQEQINVMKALM